MAWRFGLSRLVLALPAHSTARPIRPPTSLWQIAARTGSRQVPRHKQTVRHLVWAIVADRRYEW